jgi:3-oxoadipate enol-lactonase
MPHFNASDGLRIAYYVDDSTDPWKTPDTLLLLHAAMGNAKRYFEWVPPLSRHYRVVRMDMRGHGETEVPTAEMPFSMERLVADTIELLDHVGCKTPHIAGNSAGGYIGQTLAISHPDRIKSLMLFSSTPGLRGSLWPTWLKRVDQIGLRAFLAEQLADRLPVGLMDPRHVEWFLDEAGKVDPGFVRRFVGTMTTLDWSDKLGSIKCPTLLVCPGDIAIGSSDQYDVMRKRIPDVQMITYEGMPHHIADSAAERCVADVQAFLRWRFGAP